MQVHLGYYSMYALCKGLQVSRSGFYAWRKRVAKPQPLDDAIERLHAQHKQRAGAAQLSKDLQELGVQCSERTVGRRLQKLGLKVRYARKFKVTTQSHHKLVAAPNVLKRSFATHKPNTVWVGDITYVLTKEGWLYLAVFLDLYSRKVVGWQMGERIDQALVTDALEAALLSRGRPTGVIVHSDRGSQYCSAAFRSVLKRNDLIQSMSRKGDCWDNAVAESFFALLKKHTVEGQALISRQQMRQQLFSYMEIYYNRQRKHSNNGWVSPDRIEEMYYRNLGRAVVHEND